MRAANPADVPCLSKHGNRRVEHDALTTLDQRRPV